MTKEEFAQICAEEIKKMAEKSSDEMLTTILGLRLSIKLVERIYGNE